ncbi:MAG: hypothetical protein QOG84_642 [Sphingomonadales bacterium]|jgi:hypothetical protein|nr:hypothetical protein [Sphingomonadales bacterium]
MIPAIGAPMLTDLKARNAKPQAKDYKLVLATRYVARLLANARVVGHLAQCHPEILAEFQKLREAQKAS